MEYVRISRGDVAKGPTLGMVAIKSRIHHSKVHIAAFPGGERDISFNRVRPTVST